MFETAIKQLKNEKLRSVEARRSELADLLSEKMSPEEFKKQFVGEFKPGPLLQETIEFLRTATYKQIADAKRSGILTIELHREAKRILDIQNR